MTDLAKTIPGIAALSTAAKNRYARFPFAENDPTSAGWRMRQREPVNIAFKPKFSLNREDAIFTMGSCFARNVEASMIALGIRVLPEHFEFPEEIFNRGKEVLDASPRRAQMLRSVLNKYSPLSMQNEFERVFAPSSDPARGLIHVDGDRWYDPQIKNTGLLGLSDALRARDLVEDATRSVKDATAVFLTLGFTETWLDSETGVVLNVSPNPLLVRRWPNRFRFFNATCSDVVNALEKTRELITAHVRADMKFVVTVSPVPLGTTFTDMDIISANSYSKSVLRAAAGEFCARHPNVDYFPSYEMVTSTHPDLAWKADRLHVNWDVIDAVIARFVEAYIGPSAASAQSAA